MSDRLQNLETRIAQLQEQLHGMEEALVLLPMEEEPRLKQRIKKLKADIHGFEQEKWEFLARESASLDFPEAEAEVAVAEIVEAVTQLETQPVAYPDETMQILREIRDKLNETGPTAAGKLKGIVSSFPPFVGVAYEAELDTENFTRKYFPTFTRLIKGAAKK